LVRMPEIVRATANIPVLERQSHATEDMNQGPCEDTADQRVSLAMGPCNGTESSDISKEGQGYQRETGSRKYLTLGYCYGRQIVSGSRLTDDSSIPTLAQPSPDGRRERRTQATATTLAGCCTSVKGYRTARGDRERWCVCGVEMRCACGWWDRR
jgi:hypothetical protein